MDNTHFDYAKKYQLIELGLNFSLWFCLLYNFFKIMYLMRKNHRYEYMKNKRWLIAYTFFMLLGLAIHNISWMISEKQTEHTNTGFRILERIIECFCIYPNMNATQLTMGYVWYFQGKFFKVCQVTTGIVLINLKSSDDLLQGISKLDYLLIISIF